jgi:hypothetical protein
VIEYTDSAGTIKLTYESYYDGVDPYFTSYMKGKVEVVGTNQLSWSSSRAFRICLEMGDAENWQSFRERLRFNKNAVDADWEYKP